MSYTPDSEIITESHFDKFRAALDEFKAPFQARVDENGGGFTLCHRDECDLVLDEIRLLEKKIRKWREEF